MALSGAQSGEGQQTQGNTGNTPEVVIEGNDLAVSFSATDIQTIILGDEGQLIIQFKDDAGFDSLVIQNFEGVAQQDGCMKLADGTEIDTQQLYNDLCDTQGVCMVMKPDAGQTLEIALEGDKRYDLKFDMEEGRKVSEDDDGLTVSFHDGAKVVFQKIGDLIEDALDGETGDGEGTDYLSALEVIQELTVRMEELEAKQAEDQGDMREVQAELASVEGDLAEQLAAIEPAAGEVPLEQSDLEATAEIDESEGTFPYRAPAEDSPLAQEDAAVSDEVAEQVADIEPAAGDASSGAGNSGYGLQSIFQAAAINPIDDVGPINPTALKYGAEFLAPEGFAEEDQPEGALPLEEDDAPLIMPDIRSLDESNLGPLVESGQVEVDFGNDGAGEICANGEFSFGGSLTDGSLSSGGVEVVVSSTSAGYVGVAGGVSVFVLNINPQNGEYTYTQLEPFDHADGSDPNDVITLIFGVKAADSDGDSVSTTITINVLDDAPVAEDDNNDFDLSDEGAVGNVVTGENGGPGAKDDLSNDDTNNVTKVAFGSISVDVPAVGSATIDGDYGTLEIFADGSYNYTLSGDFSGEPGESFHMDPTSVPHDCVYSVTQNGITVTVGEPLFGNLDKGFLTWVDTPDVGSGFGIAGNGSDKVWQPGEVLEVTFDENASKVELDIADIGGNNIDDGMDFKIHLSDGSVVDYEFDIETTTPVDGQIMITLNAADFGDGTSLITQVDVFSIDNSGLGTTSFLLNNIWTETPGTPPGDTLDVFDYTLTDSDGDSSVATLTLKGDAVSGQAIQGTSGDDVLYGQGGDDTLYGGAGDDTLTGGEGADSFLYQAIAEGIDVIRDFSTDEGDVLDLSGLLQQYDATQQAIDNFVFAREVDGGTVISVDVGGSGNQANAVDLVALEGLQNLDIQALVENGNIGIA